MTWIPVRPAILRGALAASLALGGLAPPAGASAARAYVSTRTRHRHGHDTQRLTAPCNRAVGKRPRGLVLSPDGASLYVAIRGSQVPAPIPEEQCAKLPRDRQADGVASSTPRRSSRHGC